MRQSHKKLQSCVRVIPVVWRELYVGAYLCECAHDSHSRCASAACVFVFVMDVVIVAAHGRGSGYGRSGGRARD